MQLQLMDAPVVVMACSTSVMALASWRLRQFVSLVGKAAGNAMWQDVNSATALVAGPAGQQELRCGDALGERVGVDGRDDGVGGRHYVLRRRAVIFSIAVLCSGVARMLADAIA